MFAYIKMYADETRKRGQFYLTGSQQFAMMKNVGESLAGRIGILNLLGLSMREIYGVDFHEPFLPSAEYFERRKEKTVNIPFKDVWKLIHKGSMPAMHSSEIDWQLYYSSYTKTYIERDVRDLTHIGDEVRFVKFMTVVAGNTGNLLNCASIARDIGVSQPTVERWISILKASNIIHLLQPYYNNIAKRTIKTPKLFFLDTGLAAYLTKWNTPEVLENGAMAGAFFETFVVAEIIKSYYNAGQEPPVYFYRDKERNEIDLLILKDGMLYPIEIKKTADPDKSQIRAFGMLEKSTGLKRGPGGVVCLYDKLVNLQEDDKAIPLAYI